MNWDPWDNPETSDVLKIQILQYKSYIVKYEVT